VGRPRSASEQDDFSSRKNRKQLEAAHHAPEFRKKWPRFGKLIKEAGPCLYQVTHVEAA
jgi:hypothetical protein